jgi:Xaa-Pro aminopeptidase
MNELLPLEVRSRIDDRDGGLAAPTVGQRGAAIVFGGVVVTVEPGVYLPDVGGVRIEDTLVARQDGSRSPTAVMKDVAA